MNATSENHQRVKYTRDHMKHLRQGSMTLLCVCRILTYGTRKLANLNIGQNFGYRAEQEPDIQIGSDIVEIQRRLT